jgi:hypothetical protein
VTPQCILGRVFRSRYEDVPTFSNRHEFAEASDVELNIHSVRSDYSSEMGYNYGTYRAGSAADSEAGKYVLVLKKVKGNWLIVMASTTPGAQ